jgi:serpin B
MMSGQKPCGRSLLLLFLCLGTLGGAQAGLAADGAAPATVSSGTTDNQSAAQSGAVKPGKSDAGEKGMITTGDAAAPKAKTKSKPKANESKAEQKDSGSGTTSREKTGGGAPSTGKTSSKASGSTESGASTSSKTAASGKTSPQSKGAHPETTTRAASGGNAETSAISENVFGLSMYKMFADKENNANVFISPFSLHSVLHLTFDGAKGETSKEMAKVLDLARVDVAKGNEDYKKLVEAVGAKPSKASSFVFSTANSLWANQKTKLKPTFVEMAKDVFDAEVKNLDFAKPDSADKINVWVSERTHGKIDKIISGLSDKEILVAVNAAYFKARWETVFKPEMTKPADFKTGSGASKKVSMMTLHSSFPYLENDRMQAVELPYNDERTGMVVLLPSEKSSLPDLRKSLTADTWTAWMKKMEKKKGELSMPKFTIGFQASCKDALVAAGMKQAFSGNADFSGIVEGAGKASLSDVVHKTFVKVDEEGTEAAAASAVTGRGMMGDFSDEKPFKMVVDRPFFFAVVNLKTHAILFAGQVTDPSDK